MSPVNRANPKHSRGFSLIEALIAFMIISVGMLGIAALQTISMKAGHTAVTRTSAIINTQDIFDRMRANTTQIAAYASTATDMGTDNSCNDVENYSTNTVTEATPCSSTELAADDVFHWKNSLGQNITASIVVVPPAAPRVLNLVTVTVSWTERAVENTDLATANNYIVSVEM